MMDAVFEPSTTPLAVVAARLGLAAALGGALGLDRELRNRAAGLRTHMLVSLAAALFALLILEFLDRPTSNPDRLRIDPSRILEGVTAGVAFLAAGTIIQARGSIRGITTGAGLWLAGAIGTAVGLGYGHIALVAAVIGITIISLLRMVTSGMERQDEDDAPLAAEPVGRGKGSRALNGVAKSSGRDSMSSAHPETDHDAIRSWAEKHGGRPAKVNTDGPGGILRLDFQTKDENLEEISWEEFFRIFEDSRLALLLPDDDTSRFNKFVSRD